MIKHWTWFSILVLSLGAAWIGVSTLWLRDTRSVSLAQPQQGFTAPDFSLVSLAGDTLTLSNFAGHPVLLNFWASWCSPCKTEMPAMQEVYRAYQDQGLIILAVNVTNQDSLDQVSRFVQEKGLTFPVLLDSDGAISQRYRADALPTSFFISPTGVIREVVIGGPMSEALMRTRVETLLEEGR